jgi:hypothetical protein
MGEFVPHGKPPFGGSPAMTQADSRNQDHPEKPYLFCSGLEEVARKKAPPIDDQWSARGT